MKKIKQILKKEQAQKFTFQTLLGMYVGQNESAKFWLSILNGLQNRGVEVILIACVNGLTGFPQAIEAVFPETEIQQCIIHQIRNTTKFKPAENAVSGYDRYHEKWRGHRQVWGQIHSRWRYFLKKVCQDYKQLPD